MRSLALAQAAGSFDIPCHFFTDKGGRELAVARNDWIYPVTEVPCGNDDDENRWLTEQAKRMNASVVVVDGYDIPAVSLSGLRGAGIPVVVMDDGQLSQVAQASLVVNSTTSTLDAQYLEMNPAVKICSGPDYRLMRREFQRGDNPPQDKRFGIAVCIGGSDPKGLTVPLINALSDVLNDVPVRVITGAAFNDISALNEAIKASPLAIQHIHNCQDMADVWRHSKLAVSAAGGSQFELGVCETPSVLLMVAENQRTATEQAQQEGWCTTFDCTGDVPFDEIAGTVHALWQQPGKLEAMQQAVKGKYHAEGAFNILNAIAEVIQP